MRINMPKHISPARKKQLAMGGLVLSGILAVAGGSVFVIQSKKSADTNNKQSQIKQQKITSTDFASPQSGISDNALWANTQGAKVEDLERRMADLQTKLDQQNNTAEKGGVKSNLSQSGGISGLGNSSPLPPPPPSTAIPKAAVNTAPVNKIMTVNVKDEQATAMSGIGQSTNADGMASVRLSKDFKNNEQWAKTRAPRMNIEVMDDGGDVVVSRGKFRARDSYIPSGTFFRSVLLGGVDAPTGGDAKNASPHPVLMRVTDFAQLPNRFKYNFRECFVTGQAYGDISAERAYIRLQNLSCVGTDGRAIDMPIKGYVAGEDGKTGVRGTLVTKQGQVLANALFSGLASGLGQGIAQSFSVTNTTALGTTTSNPGGADALKAGVAQGVGTAADRLAQYYIKLADKVFPVIEVNAGRTVDIVLTQGIEIDTTKTQGSQNDSDQ